MSCDRIKTFNFFTLLTKLNQQCRSFPALILLTLLGSLLKFFCSGNHNTLPLVSWVSTTSKIKLSRHSNTFAGELQGDNKIKIIYTALLQGCKVEMSSKFLKKTPRALTSQEVAPRALHALALTSTWHTPQQKMGKSPQRTWWREGEKAKATRLFWWPLLRSV